MNHSQSHASDPSSSLPLDLVSDIEVQRSAAEETTPRHAPPFLPGPSLFAGFFDQMNGADRRDYVLPDPARMPSTDTFTGAIQRATRAVAQTGEAFHTSRGSGRSDPIDLTGSPPEVTSDPVNRGQSHLRRGADATFISNTTHPHDFSNQPSGRPRLPSFYNDPVYGFRPADLSAFAPPPPADSRLRAQRHRAHLFQARSRVAERASRSESLQEERALRQQRENHANWRRTQQRLNQIQDQRQTRLGTNQLSSSSTPEPEQSLSSGQATPEPDMPVQSTVESIDLTAVESNTDLADILSKQREEAILSQRPAGATDAGRTSFSAFKCPICMESLKNATVTKCGHIFCHKCVIDTLKWSSEQHRQENPARKSHPGTCPVCRTALAIKDTKGTARTLIPLRMMKFSLKRKRDIKGKGRAEDTISTAGGSGLKRQRTRAGRSKKVTPTPKRESIDDLFGQFTNEEEALIPPELAI